MPSDNPPTYESVAAEIKASLDKFGPDLKPQDCIDVYDNLPEEHIAILTTGPQESLSIPPEKNAAYTAGVANALSSNEAAAHISETAKNAAESCTTIENMFLSLTGKLASLEATHGIALNPLTPLLIAIHVSSQETIHRSRVSAIDIANYASDFANHIIPFCIDTTNPLEKRKARIDGFIKKSKDFESTANHLKKDFDALISRFTVFTGTFKGWASTKKGELNNEIKNLNDEIKELNKKLKKLQLSMMITGVVIAGVASILLPLMALSGPLAPFVALAGLIAIGITVLSGIVIMALIHDCNKQIKLRNDRVKEVQNEIAAIDTARSELIKLGEQDLIIFKDNINVLAQTWVGVGVEARKIQNRLNNAIDYPESEKKSLLDAGNICLGMSFYLENYARGIASSKIPSPPS